MAAIDVSAGTQVKPNKSARATKISAQSPIVEDDQGQLLARKGVSREVIEELSKVKNEPDWMRQRRLKSYEIFERMPIPNWGVPLQELNFDDLVLYSPPTTGRFNSWDDVPEDMKRTYEQLGIPQAEREHLAGVVGVWRQEPVYEGLKEEYRKLGILFCSMDTAITEYPDLVQKYFMTKCVPPQDNKFSALHGAVWSGGSFVYVPKGVKVDLPLQAYFRMEGAGEGTFEHTLIIADEGSDVNYIEGCTAQTYSVNSMHSAVVEIFVHEGAKARYTTVQNWSKDVYNLNTKRAMVDAEGTVEWVGGSMGAKYVMLYPGSYLLGEHARADHLNVGVASGKVHKDTGAKVIHHAPNTTSNILAKSISKDGGIMGYRGLVKMGANSQGSKSRVQCDGLMMDGRSRSDTWPDIQIQNPHVTVAHEATVGRISDDQLFYMGSRGFTEDEAAAMIVNGFIEPVTKELPMEYAVELNRLIQLEMVGSIG
jgi:Fe-S cluster assembly protein SufB